MVMALYFDNKLWLETFLQSVRIGFNVDLKRIYIEKSDTIQYTNYGKARLAAPTEFVIYSTSKLKKREKIESI